MYVNCVEGNKGRIGNNGRHPVQIRYSRTLAVNVRKDRQLERSVSTCVGKTEYNNIFCICECVMDYLSFTISQLDNWIVHVL